MSCTSLHPLSSPVLITLQHHSLNSKLQQQREVTPWKLILVRPRRFIHHAWLWGVPSLGDVSKLHFYNSKVFLFLQMRWVNPSVSVSERLSCQLLTHFVVWIAEKVFFFFFLNPLIHFSFQAQVLTPNEIDEERWRCDDQLKWCLFTQSNQHWGSKTGNRENDRGHLSMLSLSLSLLLSHSLFPLFSPSLPTSLTHVALACMERPDLWKV